MAGPIALASAALAGAPVAASDAADDAGPLLEYQSSAIVITGTRSDSELQSEPYAIEVIALEELEQVLPRTVTEALHTLPGVLVQKTASGHGSPYIRGFAGNRTLLMIDGVRYNNATYRDGANEYFAQIDSFTLSQIELISGPSSALYGSEAVGGVINLATRTAAFNEHESDYITGEQTVRLSSGDNSFVSRTALDLGRGGKWGLRGGVTLRHYGNVRAADLGKLPYSGYDERAYDARLDVMISPGWLATVNRQNLQQFDVPRTHSTIFSVPFAGTTVGDDLRREKDHRRSLTYAKLKGSTARPWLSTLELTLSHQSREEEEERLRSDGVRIDQSFDSEMTGFSAIATADLGRSRLTYGLDFSREDIDSTRIDTDTASGAIRERIQGPVGDDARYDQAGAFVRGVHSLSEELAIEVGLRATIIDTSIERFADPASGEAISFDDNWSNFTASLRGKWVRQNHTVWIGYGRSFRAPNIADISRFGRSRSNEIEAASLGLKPETFDTFEAAYRYRSERVEAGLTGYTTALNDHITTVPTGRTIDGLIEVARQNAASGRVSGVELWLSADLGAGFSLSGNATWLRGRLITPTVTGELREPISRIQPLTGNLALGWEGSNQWTRAELQMVDRANELSTGDLLDTQRIPPGGTPGYTLINLRGGADIAQGVSITLALNNLLGKAYRTHGSGNNEPGRHLQTSLHFAF